MEWGQSLAVRVETGSNASYTRAPDPALCAAPKKIRQPGYGLAVWRETHAKLALATSEGCSRPLPCNTPQLGPTRQPPQLGCLARPALLNCPNTPSL